MLKRFISYYKPVKKTFIIDMICSFFIALIGMMYPIISRYFLKDLIPNKDTRGIVMAAILLFIAFSVRAILSHFVQYQGHMVGTHMQANMRQEAFDHLETLPFSYFDENKTGHIMSRLVNDIQEISELAHHGPEDLFVSAVMLIASFIYLSTIDFKLTLLVFLMIPVLVIFAMRQRVKLSETMMGTRKELSNINAQLESSISGIRVSKAFVNEEYESEKFSKSKEMFVIERRKMYKSMADFYAGTGYIIDLLLLFVMVACGAFAIREIVDSDDMVTYLLFFATFLEPIRKLINFVEQFQMGTTGFERFCKLLDEEPEWEKETATEIDSVVGDIEFVDVGFSYSDEHEVFNNISFNIESGTTAAFVGPTGGGKTTLCHLIPRFYDVTSGKILLDGKDITEIKRRSLRKQIGIVQQDTFLFGGSIRENIEYGRLGASDDEIIDAAKKANIHEYIISLPNGYDTEVGERGVKLSGGQKQRISIARVFLKNPPILILDEATSALDNATEILIQEALDALCVGRTTLVVAHRLSTIRKADKIFVIEGNGVAEEGTHDELLDKKDGIYANLYEAQYRVR